MTTGSTAGAMEIVRLRCAVAAKDEEVEIARRRGDAKSVRAMTSRRNALSAELQRLIPVDETLVKTIEDGRATYTRKQPEAEKPKKDGLDPQTAADLRWWKWWRDQQRKPSDKQERDARIVALWKSGETGASIGRELGIDRGTAQTVINRYIASTELPSERLAKKERRDRALATLRSSQRKWERDRAWGELLDGVGPEEVVADQTALIPLDDDEGCPGVARFVCCSCGALGDSARCRRCAVAEDAERSLNRRTLAAWDQERLRLAEFWPEEYARRMNTEAGGIAVADAHWAARERKERIRRLFIERLTAA